MDNPELFTKAVRAADWYQRQAGGDLHYGTVVEAADILQTFVEHHSDTFVELLPSSTDEYSFHYADSIRAPFSSSHEGTIGTIRASATATMTLRHSKVDIVPFHRNRKRAGRTTQTRRVPLADRSALGRLL